MKSPCAAAMFAFLTTLVGGIGCTVHSIALAQSQYPSQQPYAIAKPEWALLDVCKAAERLKAARREYALAESLVARGLMSKVELRRKKVDCNLRRFEYEQALLLVKQDRARIIVKEAAKYRGDDGVDRVRLLLELSASAEQALIADCPEAKELSRVPGGHPAGDVVAYVSIRDKSTIVGHPYEAKVTGFDSARPQAVEFTLLKDLDVITVAVDLGDRTEEKEVLLTKGLASKATSMRCTLFSQEAELGGKATYPITIDHPGGVNTVLRLLVAGVPEEIKYEFSDPATGARLSQVRLAATETSRDISLSLLLPERVGKGILVDEPLKFTVLTLTPDEAQAFKSDASKHMSEQELRELKGGVVTLELIPRGTGKIEVLCDRLYYEAKFGHKISTDGALRNTGTHRLENIKIRWEAPRGWHVDAHPEVLTALESGQERRVSLDLVPGGQAGVGDYEVKMAAEAYVGNKLIQSPEKLLRIHIASRSALWTSLALILLLTGLLAATAVFAFRLARRER